MTGRRGRALGQLVAVCALAMLSVAGALVAATTVRLLERTEPALVLPVLSAAATALGVFWSLSPLLSGVALTETHDLDRLLHYPIPLPTLVWASLLASLVQPTVLALLPPLGVLGVALAGLSLLLLPTLGALLLFLLLLVAAGQAVSLLLHAVSRNRRVHDRTLFAGIALGVVLSFLPLLLIGGAGPRLGGLVREVLARDLFALSPFAWAARAAVHAARGEAAAFALWALGGALAVLAVLGFSAALARRMYRGERDVGEAGGVRGLTPARILLPGPIGALLEKDLKMAWRDPRQKAIVMSGMLGPLVLLVLLSRGPASPSRPVILFLLASFMGLGTLGFNALALERRGLGLLLGFPVDRFAILVAKNLAGLAVRVPGVLLLVAATVVLVGPSLVPAMLVLLLLTHLLAAAADNYLAVLFPVPAPGPGRNPHGPTSGARGLGFAAIAALAATGALAVSAPFAFLAWLPWLMGKPALWLLTLPLALGGAASVYAMLTAGAASLLRRREPELLAHVLDEE